MKWSAIESYVKTWSLSGGDHFLGMKEWASVKAKEAKLWIQCCPDHKHSVSIFDQITFAWEWVYTPSLPPLSPPTSSTSLLTTTLEPSVIWIKIVSLSDLCSTSQEYGMNLWDRYSLKALFTYFRNKFYTYLPSDDNIWSIAIDLITFQPTFGCCHKICVCPGTDLLFLLPRMKMARCVRRNSIKSEELPAVRRNSIEDPDRGALFTCSSIEGWPVSDWILVSFQ